jgi:very-short-patch-repair endonuclease
MNNITRDKEILQEIAVLKERIIQLRNEYADLKYEGLSKTEYTRKQRKLLVEANTKSREELTKEFIDKAKANPTRSESKFKAKLDINKIQYEWQRPFLTEKEWYICDFYLPEYNLVVELDGGYHLESEQKTKDRHKNAFYRRNGYYLLRITNEAADKISVEEMRDYLTRHWYSEKTLKDKTVITKPVVHKRKKYKWQHGRSK